VSATAAVRSGVQPGSVFVVADNALMNGAPRIVEVRKA
jgi:hypothetical protein